MSSKSLTSRHSIDSCLFQLHSWKPFSSNPKTLDPDANPNPKSVGLNSKRPCLSDRATSLFSLSIDNLDLSKLSLFDDKSRGNNHRSCSNNHQSRREKRRRRAGGSRSVSGRSTDRSGTRKGGVCCSVGATATATCSDFMVANGGTDSSGELFGNAVNGWASDVSEARRESGVGVAVVVESVGGFGFGFDGVGSESGYGSEPGYRGDAEFGYGDDLDDEEEDCGRVVLLGDTFGDSNMEVVGENTFSEQKTHHRGRRKKHDLRMVDSVKMI